MANNIFYLKENDTRPILEVELINPDGSAHDLTGNTSLKLFIKLNDGSVLTRTMTAVGDLTAGCLRYEWVAADWTAENDKLIVGPVPPFAPSDTEHTMEYEVVTAFTRTTFPNNGYDILRVYPDLG